MKHLTYYRLFESDVSDFIEYVGYELNDDGFNISKMDPSYFISQKYKNIRGDWRKSRQELKELKELNDMNIVFLNISLSSGIRYQFNTYDVESPVNKLISYFTKLGYSSEIRKIIMYSRSSIDVTNSFKKKIRENKRDIISLHILFKKYKNEDI